MRSTIVAVVMMMPLLGGAAPRGAILEPLVAAVNDGETHATALAEHAATAPPGVLTAPTDDEQGAFSAVVQADQALSRIMRDSAGSLHRETDIEVLAELNGAHEALATYALARMRGDRETMRAAAGDAADHLSRADAILDREKPFGILPSR